MIKLSNLLFLFIVVCIIKFSINLFKYYRLKYLLKKYREYLKNPNWEFAQYKLEIARLFKNTGIKEIGVSISENVGYGNLKVHTLSVLDNIVNRNEKVVNIVTETFYSSIGYYKSRFIETINPLFWIEFLLFVPKNIASYIGFKTDNMIANIFQITYWILGLLASIKAIFNLDIITYLIEKI